MNSNSTNLAWHFAGDGNANHNIDPRLSSLAPSAYEASTGQTQHIPAPTHVRTAATLPRLSSQDSVSVQSKYTGVANSDAENLLALSSSYNQHTGTSQTSPPASMSASFQQQQSHGLPAMAAAPVRPANSHTINESMMMNTPYTGGYALNDFSFMPGNMMIESQDVDMNMLGLDAMPWFDTYPMHLFDPNQQTAGGAGSNNVTGHGQS